MFLVRRICKTERTNVWKVAGLLKNICNAYEEKGRKHATVYIGGFGTPASEITVCAEWEQETIEANRTPNVPSKVLECNGIMQPLLSSYEIEFYEIATEEKLTERGVY